MGTEEQWEQSNSGHRGTVGTEEQRAQRNGGHRGTVGIHIPRDEIVNP